MCKPKVNAFKVAGPGGVGMERDSEEKNKETIVLFVLVLAFVTFFKMLYKMLKLLVTF